MGTINYKTSDYITLGYNCNNIDYDDPFYSEMIQDDYDQTADTRARYDFYYFHVSIDPGYYDGFCIEIEHNFTYCYDNYEEKRAALREITQIKKFLLECVDVAGLCAVSPGWCTSYYDREETIIKIDAAIKEMRQTVKDTPTWATLPEHDMIPAF